MLEGFNSLIRGLCVVKLFMNSYGFGGCFCAFLMQVAAAVKGLSVSDILAFEQSGSILLAGHELSAGDIKVG